MPGEAFPRRPAIAAGPADFFAAVHSAFLRAETAAGPHERLLSVGGYPVRLRFAGQSMDPVIHPALAHLAAATPGRPALTVCIWDSNSTGVQIPPAPWTPAAYGLPRGEIAGYNTGRIRTAFQVDARALCLLDLAQDLGIFWVPDARQVPYYESGAPLRFILQWWQGEHGRQLAHAAAVGTEAGAVLLAGKGGSGKSTTALACLLGGLDYVGDDYVLLGRDPEPFVHGLYNTAKLNADNVARLPSLAGRVRNADRLGQEKALFFLRDHFPDQVRAGLPLRAVLLPRVTGERRTYIERTTAAPAVAALAASTIFQLSNTGQQALQVMARLVAALPCYVLAAGTDLDAIPGVVSGLLSS